MRIETIAIENLRPNSWNPNEMDDHIYRSLTESIRKYGVVYYSLVRSDMTIVKGKKRWRAVKKAGLTDLVCVIVEFSDEESKLLTISLSHLRGRTNELRLI
ncbi:ParB N-terminal domain-containing protein [Paenibacillus sp. SI8]|uniref:ParB N-terminal domain-containing protein n=1 Tax=unclassified Paenibacillus TaxID=185978 RepID=UPI003464EA2C